MEYNQQLKKKAKWPSFLRTQARRVFFLRFAWVWWWREMSLGTPGEANYICSGPGNQAMRVGVAGSSPRPPSMSWSLCHLCFHSGTSTPQSTVSEGVEEKTDFTRIMAAWFNRSVTPSGNSLPAYSFFSTLSFIFPRFSSRFLIAHPRRVKALSSSDTKKKLTGTAANPAASS